MNSLLVKTIPSEDQKNPRSSRPPMARYSRRRKRQYTFTIWRSQSHTVYEIDLVTREEMCLKFYQTSSYLVVHVGNIPAACIARVVGHDETILHERPFEVAPYTPAIQADFRASGDRLLDPHQQTRLDLIRSCVNSILQARHRKGLENTTAVSKERYGSGCTYSGVSAVHKESLTSPSS